MDGVDALCARAVSRYPAAALLAPGGVDPWRAAAVEDRIARLAGWLAGQGPRGSRVAVWDRKSLTACILPLAAARTGWVSVSIAPVLRVAQVAHILADSGATLLLASPARAVGLAMGATRLVDPADAMLFDGDAIHQAVDPDPDRLVQLLYTSGSTGRPKGVMLTDRNLALGAEAVVDYLGLRGDDVILGLLPLSFDYGQNQWLSALRAGATFAPVDYLTAADAVRAGARAGATVIAGVPPMWRQLVAARWPDDAARRVRLVTNSGGALTPDLIAGLRRTFPAADIVAMYGLTEAFRSTYLPPDRLAAKPRSIGRAIPHAEVLVCRPDGGIAGVGEPGELVHCGPLVAGGYWNDAVATAGRFRPAPPASRMGGMAVWSGDIVVRDADGDLSFVTRRDALMKVGGYRVGPAEVEEPAIATGLAAEAVAFALAAQDGEPVIALATEGCAPGDVVRLAEALRQVLPSYQLPAVIVPMTSMPRTSSGKIDRPAVIAAATAAAPTLMTARGGDPVRRAMA